MNTINVDKVLAMIEEVKKWERESEEVINHYKGNLKRAAKNMKKLYDMDDETSDADFYKVKRKVEHLIRKERLNIELKINELKKELVKVALFESVMKYNNADLWFSYLKDKTLKEKLK